MQSRTLGQAAQLMETAFKSPFPFSKAIVDSRHLSANDLFFALPGEKTDGHLFLQNAAQKGAAAAVVRSDYTGFDFGLPLIRVPDVLLALQNFAKNELKNRKTRIVAVTGSVGKTTTKEFLVTILKQSFRVGATPGNSNSQIGMPLAILNDITGNEEVLVVEMGMTHPGNIQQLIQIAPPTIAVITTVALVHALNFESLRDIAKAKAEIFMHPETQLGIYNCDVQDADVWKETGKCKKMTFSESNKSADFHLKSTSEFFEVETLTNENHHFGSLPVPGKHNHMNALAAIAVARSMDMPWDAIQRGFQELTLPERRLQIVSKKGITFVNDSYNASEISLKAALASLPEPQSGRKKIAVIGEMLELGKFSEKCHQEVARTALQHVDHLLCMGKECAPMHELWTKSCKPVYWLDERSDKNRALLVQELKRLIVPGDVVLLKGSRTNQLWKVLEEI